MARRYDVGDTAVVAIHTPGHAPDHLCFWHAESRTLFGGDLAVQGNTVWIPTSLQGDLTDYLASIERVLALAGGFCPRMAPLSTTRRRCSAVHRAPTRAGGAR